MTKEEFKKKYPKLYKTYSSKYVAEDVSDINAHSYWDVLDFMYKEGVKAGLSKANKLAGLREEIHGQSEEDYITIKKEDLDKLQNERDELSAGLTEYVDAHAEKRRKIEQLEKEKEELEDKLQSCEEANKSLRKQISEDSRALEEEHDAIINRPIALAAHLASLGFKGTLTREQPFFNTNISMDKRAGLYTETLKVE